MSPAVATAASTTFAISPTTQKIIKNFSGMSDSLLLVPGTTQRQILESKSVFAVAEFPEPWPQETALYDLNLFVGAVSQFDKPAVTFAKDAMVIAQDVAGAKLRISYRYSDPSTIDAPPSRTLPNDNEAVSFVMSAYTLSTLKKTASLLKLTHFVLTANKNGVTFTADDPKIPNSHQFSIDVVASDVTVNDKSFDRSLRFQIAHFAYLMDGDYDVLLSDWKYAYAANKGVPVAYYVAEDKDVA